MSRIFCSHCQRPETACICRFTTPVSNDVHVVVLQHPSEIKQTKGTIALLAQSLKSCQVIVGEDFSSNAEFQHVLEEFNALLLYPGDNAKTLDQMFFIKQHIEIKQEACGTQRSKKPVCLVIIDGTWKKSYRMFMISNNLQTLPQVCLPQSLANAGQYHIRKVAKKNALSSLEAACYALALFESQHDISKVTPKTAGKYQVLLNKFDAFNQFQLSFRPLSHQIMPRKNNES